MIKDKHDGTCKCKICLESRLWYHRTAQIKKVLEDYDYVTEINEWNIYRKGDVFMAHGVRQAILLRHDVSWTV